MTKKIFEVEIRKIVDNDENSSDSDSGKSDKSINDENLIDLSHPHISKEEIEKIVGRKIKNPFYYQRSLVHKSVQGMVRKVLQRGGEVCEYMKESNERMEFLGDKIFGMAATWFLFHKYPNEKEGFLTQTRTRIEKGTTMSVFAEKMGLTDKVLMSQYVIKSANGTPNKNLLENAFEAFVGAISLDLGREEAHEFSLEIINKYITEEKIMTDDNYKDLFLRYSQYKKWPAPEYVIVNEEGPSHKKEFTIEVRLYEKTYGTAQAKKKKKAEQLAAEQAVKFLKITNESFKEPR
jgi:ribonuclease-3